MLTNNWYSVFKALFADTANLSGKLPVRHTTEDNVYYAKPGSGSSVNSYVFPAAQLTSAYICTNLSSANNHIAFGDGDTPPTKDDRTLSGNLITTLSIASRNGFTSVDGDTLFYCVNMAIKNTGADAVTIREIAWLGAVTTTYKSGTHLMFDRTVLDSPVTIPAGGTESITYKIGVNITTA